MTWQTPVDAVQTRNPQSSPWRRGLTHVYHATTVRRFNVQSGILIRSHWMAEEDWRKLETCSRERKKAAESISLDGQSIK